MAFVYHKPPVFCYQAIDRQSLQFTNYPVFHVYNPPPPEPTPPPDEDVHGDVGPSDEPPEGEEGVDCDAGDPAGGA